MSEFPMGADERLEVAEAGGAAEVLLWWRRTPDLPSETVGLLGGFRATTADAAQVVLTRALARLRQEGCSLAVGPMDGSTWQRYRFVTDPGTEPPFLFEPVNPAAWPEWWRAVGFAPLAEYYSTVADDLTRRDERIAPVAVRLAAAGVTIRPLNVAAFEAELGRIYDVSAISFQSNFLYTPQPRDAFIAQYRSIQGKARPELVLLAEHAGRPVGYVFALPDLMQAQRGLPVTTVIVKTLAVLPGRTYAGLGAVLLDRVHETAARLGFGRVIHALMHERNVSRNLSAHTTRTIRRYALLARPTASP